MTQETREKVIVARFLSLVDSTWHARKLFGNHPLDFVFLSQEPNGANFDQCHICGFCEIKERTCAFQDFDKTMLPFIKWRIGRDYSRNTGAPFIFLIKWRDCMKAVRIDLLKREDVKFAWGGRNNRDAKTHAPYVYIPLDLFKHPDQFKEILLRETIL